MMKVKAVGGHGRTFLFVMDLLHCNDLVISCTAVVA